MTWNPLDKRVSVPHQDTVDWPDRGLSFHPPALAPAIAMDRHNLSLSIGRNLARASMRPSVLRVLIQNAWNLFDGVMDRYSSDLSALPDISDFGDQALNSFAHDMAVGIAGVLMERQGYVWRTHANEVLPLAARPDYVWYHRTAPRCAILTEVKGMAGTSKPFGALITRTRKAFDKQVNPWRLDYTSAGDPVGGGYAIGVHVAQSRAAAVTAVRSRLVSTIASPGTKPASFAGGPSPTVARMHYGDAVTLLGLGGMAARIAGLPSVDAPAVLLDMIEIDGMNFFVRTRDHSARRFGMRAEALAYASSLEGDRSPRVGRPPIFEGVETRGLDPASPLLAMSADGLALIARPTQVHRTRRAEWSPQTGLLRIY